MIAAALTALALLQDTPAPVLLPDAPDGWTFERLDFPLSFAPELEYRGFEELRFAPGMFDAASDEYFSYVLDIRLDESLAVDEAFLDDLLETYYRGLCVAVGGGRGLELDAQTIDADVRFDGVRYLAEVRMIDPFVTGGPLTLQLELDVLAGPRTTELLGLVSPAPPDGRVWSVLRGVRDTWRAARAMPVFLNHLFVVPDRETYDALASSMFLRTELGVFEERTTVRADLTYTGLYLYGRNTYFEFLSPSEGFPAGKSGVAFGVEVAGGTERLSSSLSGIGIPSFAGSITRELDGEQVPWFRILGIQAAHAEMRLDLFSLEYVPEFLERWHPDRRPASGGIARRAVLERYARTLGTDPAAPLFEDVVAIHLALDETERARLTDLGRVFGYELEATDAGWTIHAPSYRMFVTAADAPGGITGFDLALRRAVEPRTLTFGSATLRLAGTSASLRF